MVVLVGASTPTETVGLWRNSAILSVISAAISSVAFWYQTLPTVPFPALPARDQLEVN